MKKKYIIFSIVTLVLLVALVTSFNYFKTTNTYVEDNSNNQTKITKGISMNLEQTAGAGDYKTVTQSSWPTEGYKFNTELSRCENGSELSWDDTKKAVIVSGNLSDKCYVYFDIYAPTLVEYVTSLYTGTQGDNNIYYHDSSLTNGAKDNSYRFAGENPNNYVCFGSDASPCPENSLYRMIGVINNKVKLIKATFATKEELGNDGAYSKTENDLDLYSYFDVSEISFGTENLISINLNTNFKTYIENINSKWLNFVESENFVYVYDAFYSWDGYLKNTCFDLKRKTSTSYLFSIMGASDYVFSSSSSYWNKSVTSNDSDSYLYISNSSEYLFGVLTDGLGEYIPLERLDKQIYFDESGANIPLPTRPVFYLNADVTYVSGDGSQNTPIRLS